jgi:hypothetical protein
VDYRSLRRYTSTEEKYQVTGGASADLATLTFQLKILRRQPALLPERPSL